jgi:hypothetical protein
MRYYATPNILKNTDPAELAWRAIEPIWDNLPLTNFSTLAKFMDTLSPGQRGLIALDWCQKEIRNGGLMQLFANSTGNLVPWGINGFKMIRAFRCAAILDQAASMLGAE